MDGTKLLLVSLGVCVLGCNRGGAAAVGDPAASADGAAVGGAAGVEGGATNAGDAASADALAAEDVRTEAGPLDKTIVLGLMPADGEPLGGVASVVVTFQEDGASRTRTFAHDPAKAIDEAAPLALMVIVGPAESGSVIFVVDALSAAGCKLAKGLSTVLLIPDATVHAAVALQRLDDCAVTADGGAPDATTGDGATPFFAGCRPLDDTCGDEMTCALRCATKTAACVAAGSAFHGTACAGDADCAPGSQCIDYASAGCGVKVCRRFCAEDANCPQPVQAGGPTNVCAVPFSCSGAGTAYRTCTVSCDPTFRARANGDPVCPDGLSCVLLDPDHADCACPPATRTKLEGAACTITDECAPGLVCNLMGATRTCRALCRCNVEDGACAAFVENACPTAGMHCAPLTGGTVYGVCVP